MREILVIEIHNFQEFMQGFHCGGAQELDNCFHFVGKCRHPLQGDVVAEEGNGRLAKLTLSWVDDMAVFLKMFKQQAEVRQVVLIAKCVQQAG